MKANVRYSACSKTKEFIMKTNNRFLLTAALALAISFTFSCSDSGGSEPIKKAKISGVSQKGPFVEGSKATLYELNGSFEQTGKSFTDIIADNKGSFEIKSIELVSPYAMLEASGYYRNENTGEVSKSPITLFAIADIREKDQVNVNILTHLEYHRVLNLAEQGKSVKEAKKQAQKEIFAVFGIDSDNFKDSEDMSIFGTSESDAALLAISVLLQSDLSEGEFSQRLTNFAQAVKTGGDWDNEAAKTAMADWAMEAKTKAIKSNILGWGLASEVPAFEKYVYDYWIAVYGLGDCGSSNEGNIKIGGSEKEYVCKYGIWRKPSYIDKYCSENICSSFVDERDNQPYMSVVIGEQTWMAENLNYNATGSKCYGEGGLVYDEESGLYNAIRLSDAEIQSNCDKYGRLYDWTIATERTYSCDTIRNQTLYSVVCSGQIEAETKHQGICPSGWHIPNNAEWNTLMKYVGTATGQDYYMGATKLRAESGWNANRADIPGTDDYGFAAMPGGNYSSGNGFYGAGYTSGWLGTNSFFGIVSYSNAMQSSIGEISSYSYFYSVRCLKD
jgi:uncharacterized protein (TIGR02145 family)